MGCFFRYLCPSFSAAFADDGCQTSSAEDLRRNTPSLFETPDTMTFEDAASKLLRLRSPLFSQHLHILRFLRTQISSPESGLSEIRNDCRCQQPTRLNVRSAARFLDFGPSVFGNTRIARSRGAIIRLFSILPFMSSRSMTVILLPRVLGTLEG